MKTMPEWMCAAMAALAVLGASAETWTFKAPRAWSRAKGAATLTARADGALELRHTGDQDWSIHGIDGIRVRPGDVFRFSCESEALPDMSNAQPYALSATM